MTAEDAAVLADQALDEMAARDARVAELEHEVLELRGSHQRACETIAQMHAAAVGSVRGPIRGVVEDVEDLGCLRDLMRDLLKEVNTLVDWDEVDGAHAMRDRIRAAIGAGT